MKLAGGKSMMRVIASIASLAVLVSLVACAGQPSALSASAALVGEWENVAEAPKRPSSAGGVVLDTVGIHKPPWASNIVFRQNGRFDVSYPEAQAERFRRLLGEPSLENPVEGAWHVERDWVGVLWIDMNPGPGTRRLSLEDGILILHRVGDAWGAERFRRP
jgi:hypothetical protein